MSTLRLQDFDQNLISASQNLISISQRDTYFKPKDFPDAGQHSGHPERRADSEIDLIKRCKTAETTKKARSRGET